jgi:type IX secretion system PorP/SprF family membrane protein
MNRFLYLFFLFLLGYSGLQAQNRKYISNFAAHQSYYNPALTGNEGSMLRSFYRNQWTGFEDAPKMLYFSGEFDLQDLGKAGDRTSHYQYRDSQKGFRGAQHALGFVTLQERFGPTRETQFGLNYGTGVRLTEKLGLRFGTALTFNNFRLDGSNLVLDNNNDPRYNHLLGQQNGMSKLDLNLGMALVSANFYLGYAMQDVTKGHFMRHGDDVMRDIYTRKHVLQGGFRTAMTDQFGLILNGLYQYDEQLKGVMEGQAKAVFNNMLWLGAGYRHEQAMHVGAGLHYGAFRVSYTYESPLQEARSISRSTNEIGLALSLRQPKTEIVKSDNVLVW